MKNRILFILMLVIISMVASAQNKKIAILETVDKEGNVPYGIRLQLRSNLTYAISNTPGYEGYDRVDMSQILGEHDFQRTGLVSDEQIRKLGVMAGVSSIVIAEAAIYDKENIIITAKILNVETASVERAVPPQISSTNPEKMQKACEGLADKLLANEPIETEIPETETIVRKGLITEEKDFWGTYYALDEQRLTTEEYMKLINNCPESKYYYEKGCRQRKTGNVLLYSGIGGIVLGGSMLGLTIISESDVIGPYVIGGGLLFLGSVSTIVAIPIYTSGKQKKNNEYKVYNEYCAKPTAKLSFGPTANGIGVCLSF